MKLKIILLLQVFLLYSLTGKGQKSQQPEFGDQIMFSVYTTDAENGITTRSSYGVDGRHISQILSLPRSGQSYTPALKVSFKPVSPIRLGVKLNPHVTNYSSSKVKSNTKEYESYIISDGSAAEVIPMGINSANVKDYRYHVVLDDSIEIVPWSEVPLDKKFGAEDLHGYLGKFGYPGSQLLVEVVNIKDYSIREGVVFNWKKHPTPSLRDIWIYPFDNPFNLNNTKTNRGYATQFNAKTKLPLDFKFQKGKVEDIRLNFNEHQTIPFAFFLISENDGKRDTTELEWYFSGDFYDLNHSHFDKPGRYQLIIQRVGDFGQFGEESMLRLNFEVLAQSLLDQKSSLKELMPYGLATLSGVALLFIWVQSNNRRKLKKAQIAKAQASQKLNSVRAQLNPHFMFNALTSIQNLMHKNDQEAANKYLAKFATLTRNVLNTSENQLIPLDEELKMLEDYLQMEQLRFDFNYCINVDDSINSSNVEVPAMLLQPLVENGIKHGISAKGNIGKIEITIDKKQQDLIMIVEDNGKGFDVKSISERTGYGIKLSEERISLLNEINKDQLTTMQIESGLFGTAITLTLHNLL